jgi:hypothetical protein
MILRILRMARHAGWLALVATCTVASACSSNPPTPDAFVAATVGVGSQSPASVCNNSGAAVQFLDIGSPTGPKPTPVQDGNSQSGGANVHVTCTVSTSGSGFDINLQALLDGPHGGSITITSPSGQGAVTANGGSGITAAFQSGAVGNYRQNGCTISFTYGGAQVGSADNPAVAAGRIWGHVSCPAAQSATGQTVTGPDGGSQPPQCDGEADFFFENCSQ